MKRLYVFICLMLCVLCITAAKKTSDKKTAKLSKTQQIEKSLLASVSLLKGLNIFVPEDKKQYLAIGTDLLTDAAYVVSKTDIILAELKNLRAVAQRIKSQGQCFISGKKADMCQAVNCMKQRECAEQLLLSIHKLLMPVIQQILGVVEVTQSGGQMKKSIKPGLILALANSSVVPQSYRLSWNQLLGDFTIKLNDTVEFLPKLGKAINVPLKKANEPKEYQNYREDPIIFEDDDIFAVD